MKIFIYILIKKFSLYLITFKNFLCINESIKEPEFGILIVFLHIFDLILLVPDNIYFSFFINSNCFTLGSYIFLLLRLII